jgi:hypothetical protein
LFAGLHRHGWPVICIDARDSGNGARSRFSVTRTTAATRGIADLMRVNKYRSC